MNHENPYLATETGRFAILRFTPEALVWMTSGRFEAITNLLPNDVLIVRIFADNQSHPCFFCIVLTSKEFARVEKGDPIPELPPVIIRRGGEMEVLNITKDSLLVMRGISWESFHRHQLRKMMEEKYGANAPTTVIFLSGSQQIEALDEAEMREHGWIRSKTHEAE
jgi:hypothetical protein